MALKLQVWNSVRLIILKHEYFVFDVITIEKKKKQNLTNCVHLADINYNGTNMTLNLVLSRYFRTFFITFYAIRLIIDNPLHSHTCAKNNSWSLDFGSLRYSFLARALVKNETSKATESLPFWFSKSESIQSRNDKCSLFVWLYGFALSLSGFSVHIIIVDV